MSCTAPTPSLQNDPKIVKDVLRANFFGDSIRLTITDNSDTIWNKKMRGGKWEKIGDIDKWAIDTNNIGGNVDGEDICLFNFGYPYNQKAKMSFFYPSKSIPDQWIRDITSSIKNNLPSPIVWDSLFMGFPSKLVKRLKIDSADLDDDNTKEIIIGIEGTKSYCVSFILKKHSNAMWKIIGILGPNFLGDIVTVPHLNLICSSNGYSRSDHSGKLQTFYKIIEDSTFKEVFHFALYQEKFKRVNGRYWEELTSKVESFSKTKIITNYEYREYSGKKTILACKKKLTFKWSDKEQKYINSDIGDKYPNITYFKNLCNPDTEE